MYRAWSGSRARPNLCLTDTPIRLYSGVGRWGQRGLLPPPPPPPQGIRHIRACSHHIWAHLSLSKNSVSQRHAMHVAPCHASIRRLFYMPASYTFCHQVSRRTIFTIVTTTWQRKGVSSAISPMDRTRNQLSCIR